MSVERKPSFTTTPRRRSMDLGQFLDPRPHTRVDDEGAIEKKYLFGEVLGQGSFGVVHEITNRQTGVHFAVKIVNKDKPGSSTIQLLEREVEVLKRVNHPHIIKLEEVFETPKKMYLVMELCKGGELTELLKQKGCFREEEAKILMRRLTEVVVYMHDKDMVHRDLKLENILLSSADPTDEFNIKVTDFGLVHMRSLPGCDNQMYSRCGTPYYMAPEVLNSRHEYTEKCDVWSLGVIMYAMLCGRVPFQSDNHAKLDDLILRGELKFTEFEWINVSPQAKDLIRAMLCVETTQRFTARRVLDHPWFTGQSGRGVLGALALMQEIQSEMNSTTRPIRTSLETVSETEQGDQRQQPQSAPETPKKTMKSLVGKRANSSPSVTPSGSGALKCPSTSAISSRSPSNSHQGRSRISSTGPKQATGPGTPKRPSTSCVRDRKYSSPAGT